MADGPCWLLSRERLPDLVAAMLTKLILLRRADNSLGSMGDVGDFADVNFGLHTNAGHHGEMIWQVPELLLD